MDERDALELLDSAAQRREPDEVGHEVDRHRIVADLAKDVGEPSGLRMRQRDDHDVDLQPVEHRP